MLNELYDAASSLAGVGINPKNWHKEYVPVRAPKLAFFVYIDHHGKITDIKRVGDATEVADLRTWESKGDLRQSFPYFNIPPLMWIHFDPKSDENDKSIEKALKTETLTQEDLRRFVERAQKTKSTKYWEEKHYNKLQSCLEKGKDLKSILGQAPEECRPIVALIDRLESTSAQDFYVKLQEAFTDKLQSHPETAAKYFKGLFYSESKELNNAMTLLLELSDGTSRFGFPVRHTKIRDWINGRLLTKSPAQDISASVYDIFGNDGAGCEQTFDDVRMKNVLGNVKLRAMVGAARCQYRYGEAEADSCPVGHESRSKMKGALEWLTDPDREGKTWATVARASGNKEILLAYPSVLPPEPPDTATFFGGPSESDADDTGRFEDCAQSVVNTLHGLMAKNRDLDIRVFVLRKMDPARTRVSSHRRYSAQHLIHSAELWQRSSHNLPRVLIKQFTKGKPEWREPETPFPMEVVWVLNTQWSRHGNSANGIKGVTAEDGVKLLLEEGWGLQPILQRALYDITRNGIGLVLALGQAHAQGKVIEVEKRYAKQATRQAIVLPSLLGLLLLKLNITKEGYMKSPPYLVGRLLSLADQLHYHYCQHVRDRNVPPQLMGNALMPTALEEPVKALALYSNRILPYQAWAKTVSGDAAGLARYFLSELGKTCSEVSLSEIPERCTDAEKAQMLIGYLAKPGKTDSEMTQQGDEA